MFKTNAPASVANAYVDKNVSTSTPGTKIIADDQNIKQDELTNAVESASLALDATGAKRAQLAQAINILGASASAMVDTGVADAYVVDHVSSAVVPPDAFAEMDGFAVVFIPANINTGAATLDYAGLGAKPITTSQGAALAGGEMKRYVALQYNLTSDRWELMFSEIAINHFYDNTASGLNATDAQAAIDEVVAGRGLLTHNFTSDSGYTLTSAENTFEMLKLTDTDGLLTSTRNVFMGGVDRIVTVINKTTQFMQISSNSIFVNVFPGETISVNVTPSGTFTLMGDSEFAEAQRLAAALDPDSIVQYIAANANLPVTVPAGEYWTLLSAWKVLIQGSNDGLGNSVNWYDRSPAAGDSTVLSPGTVIDENPTNTGGKLLVSVPSLVTADAKYTNPVGLIAWRKSILKTLDVKYEGIYVTLGTARGTTIAKDFSSVFSKGIVIQVSAFDVSWLSLDGVLTGGGMNLNDEISDDHIIRFTRNMLVPFATTMFSGIQTRVGSVSGDTVDTSARGDAIVLYSILPTNW